MGEKKRNLIIRILNLELFEQILSEKNRFYCNFINSIKLPPMEVLGLHLKSNYESHRETKRTTKLTSFSFILFF